MAVVAKNSPYIVGIDLGTSNSTAAIYLKGRAEVIPLDGRPMLPSVVNVRDTGEVVVGYAAKNVLLIDPENTVSSVKRELGNPHYSQEFKGQPGKKYTATDLSAEILAKIRSGVEQSDYLDLRGSLRYAVICVPANFDDAKKQATLEAGRLAGLEVLWLLEEPVAAAIAYALEAKRDQKILVYDLGGGTFDVSILNVDSTEEGQPKFRVLAKEGIPVLGGDDFDEALMKIVAANFKSQSGIDIFDLQRDQGISRRALRQAQQKLKEAAETAKIELTDAMSSEILLPNFIKDESGTVHNIEMTVTIEQFENAIHDLVSQTRSAIGKALESAKITIDDVSRIILVGGSTHVPLVRRMLSEMFGKEPYGDLDPATTVARGAAVFGATLGVPTDKVDETAEVRPEDTPDVNLSITNIVTHFLGIEIANGRFSKILDKNLEIPDEAALVQESEYVNQRDFQQEIRIAVFQSPDEPRFVSDEGCVCIGEFFLAGIPPKPKGQARINVKFEINQQNILKVSAVSKDDAGIANELEINRTL
jgi:molecular chaperone DnaK (HSP70)